MQVITELEVGQEEYNRAGHVSVATHHLVMAWKESKATCIKHHTERMQKLERRKVAIDVK